MIQIAIDVWYGFLLCSLLLRFILREDFPYRIYWLVIALLCKKVDIWGIVDYSNFELSKKGRMGDFSF